MSEIDSALLADLLRQAMREGKLPFVTVVSNSMSPLIRQGDQIRIGPTTAENLQPGDIIVYSGLADLITHRYWGFLSDKDQTQLVTKGDRPQHFDQPFTQANFVGQVIGRRRNRQLLNLSTGAGKWLNNHLAKLARLEIRLFSKSLTLLTPSQVQPTQVQLPSAGGRLSDSQNGLLIRLIRRFLYTWAIILNMIISATLATKNINIED
jgi:signal peptidase I